jgi:hypothetical protein
VAYKFSSRYKQVSVKSREMDKTLRKVTSFEDQRAETYRYWRSRPSAERFEATWEMSREMYAAYYQSKGIVHVEGPARSFTRVQRSRG